MPICFEINTQIVLFIVATNTMLYFFGKKRTSSSTGIVTCSIMGNASFLVRVSFGFLLLACAGVR